MKIWITAIALVLIAGSSYGATWHVSQDGSGDFTVIQDAVDAASPGDVIWIHAGRYEEMTEHFDIWGNGSSYADCHVVITKDDLTLQGDGPDNTIIGSANYPADPDPNLTGISVTYNEASSLTVRDLAIENVRYGVYAASHTCEVTGCRLEAMGVEGMRLYTSTSCVIGDCDFLECGTGVLAFSPTGHVSIWGSHFLDSQYKGVIGAGAESVEITNCTFTGGAGAVDFQQGTSGVVSEITASDYLNGAVVLSMGGSAEIYDSVFEGGGWGVYSNGDRVYCERTSFLGQTNRTIDVNNNGDSAFHDCEFINGGGWTVYCRYNGSNDCHIDMTNNYWGTDSAEQIAEWIHDSNDDPDDCCTVDFIPFQGSVAVETRSWSSVKGLFRGDGE